VMKGLAAAGQAVVEEAVKTAENRSNPEHSDEARLPPASDTRSISP
jgi:hypothetical protein